MALDPTLETLDSLEDNLKTLYVEKEGGGYQLDVAGGIETPESIAALKRAKEHEKTAKQEALTKAAEIEENYKSQLTDIQKKLEEFETGKHKENDDFDSLKASLEEKHNKALAEKEEQLSSIMASMKAAKKDSVTGELAKELEHNGSYKALKALLDQRVTVEMKDGSPEIVVLGEDGGPTVHTVSDLKEELLNDPAFAGIIKGSNATGGGASPGQGGSGASKKCSEMVASEKSAYIRKNGLEAWKTKVASEY